MNTMRHIPTNLYIDTEVIVRNNLELDTGGFKQLKEVFERGDLRLLVPKMMERELFRKYKKRSEEAAKALEKAHKFHPVNSLPLDVLPSGTELEKQCLDELKRQWEEFKKYFVLEELPLVGNLEEVVDWYFETEAPFSKKKSKKNFQMPSFSVHWKITIDKTTKQVLPS